MNQRTIWRHSDQNQIELQFKLKDIQQRSRKCADESDMVRNIQCLIQVTDVRHLLSKLFQFSVSFLFRTFGASFAEFLAHLIARLADMISSGKRSKKEF